MLEFKNITLIEKNKKDDNIILDDISFNLPNSGLITFKGKFNDRQPLLKLIAGFLKPTSGEFLFDGKKINYKNPFALSKYRFNNIGLAQRKDNFFEMLTVKENYDLLNLYTRKIKEDKIAEVLNYIGLDESVLGLKPQALSKGEQQKLAISKPLLLDTPIIIIENPLKYLDTKDEIDDVLNLIKKISKEKLVLVFTNDCLIESSSDGIVQIIDKKIASNTIKNDTVNTNIPLLNKDSKVSSFNFISKTSASLSITNLNYNIWIFLFIIFGLIFMLLGVQYKTKGVNSQNLRKNLIAANNKYAFLSANRNIMQNPLSDLNLNSDIFYKRYFVQRDITDDKKTNRLTSDIKTIVEVKDFNKSGFKLLAGRYPENTDEVLITKKTALKMLYEIKQENADPKDLASTVIDSEFTFKVNGNVETSYDVRKVSGIIDDSDKNIVESLYVKEGFYKKILSNGIHNLEGVADITDFKYTGKDKEVERRISDYNGIKNKLMYYKDIYGFIEKTLNKQTYLATIDKYKGKKLEEIHLEDDEVILPASLYNQIFNDAKDRLAIKREIIEKENPSDPTGDPIQETIYEIKGEDILKDATIEITTRTARTIPNNTPNGIIKKRYKVVGVLYGEKNGKKELDINITGKTYHRIDESLNSSIIFSNNQMKKISNYVKHPFEYMANLERMDEATFEKDLASNADYYITSEIIASANKILKNQTAQKASIAFLVFGTLFFVLGIYISVKLTKSRYKKRNNLFATFWMGGRNEFEIKLGFAFNNLLMSLAGFVLAFILAPLFIYFFQLIVIGDLKNIFGMVYKFSGKDFGYLLLFALLFAILNTLVNILFMNKKNLKVGKYLN